MDSCQRTKENSYEEANLHIRRQLAGFTNEGGLRPISAVETKPPVGNIRDRR